MKKIVFLVFGSILVIAILALPKGGTPSEVKKIICEASQVIGASIIKVYRDLRTYGTSM
jgi:hypothetical protein